MIEIGPLAATRTSLVLILVPLVFLPPIYLYGWLCSRNAARWLNEREKYRVPNTLSDGRKPYEWTEYQMDEAERAEKESSQVENSESGRIIELEDQNRHLRAELDKLLNWPEELEDKRFGSVAAWRGRALVAERKLEKSYERMRVLDEQINELKGVEI